MQSRRALLTMLESVLLLAAWSVRGTAQAEGPEKDAWRDRPFVLVRSAPLAGEQGVTQNYYGGAYDEGSRLRDYARVHPGDYLLYAQAGRLYRVDTPAVLAEAERLYAPMRPLAETQARLAAAQKPLSAQQRTLSAEMRATRDPAEMGRIGREQGAVGQQQGAIGREQGAVGRQQGVLGRAFYRGVQGKLDSCLAEKSCVAEPVA